MPLPHACATYWLLPVQVGISLTPACMLLLLAQHAAGAGKPLDRAQVMPALALLAPAATRCLSSPTTPKGAPTGAAGRAVREGNVGGQEHAA